MHRVQLLATRPSAAALALVIFGALARPAAGAPSTADDLVTRPYRDQIVVRATPRHGDDVARIWGLAETVLSPHDPSMQAHDLVVTPATLRTLRAAGVPLTVQHGDAEGWLAGITRQERRDRDADLQYDSGKLGLYGEFFTQVRPLAEIEARLRLLAGESQGRAEVIAIGRSIQGRDLLAVRISSAPRGSQRASIVVVGTQHAREWVSPMVTMGLADALIRQYEKDPRVRRVVDSLDVFIVPVGNPDGYVATFNGRRLQRKNMNAVCNVDLNRNYDVAFGLGVSRNCSTETYPGTAAFSEPETRAIRDLVQSLPKVRLFYDYHANAAQVMIPYAHTTARPPNYEKNRTWCELYAATLQSVHGTRHPARPGFNLGQGSGGGAFDWFRLKHGESLVVELGGGPGFHIAPAAIIPAAEENFVAWMALAEKVVDENPTGGPTEGGIPEPGVSDAGAAEVSGVEAAPATDVSQTGELDAGAATAPNLPAADAGPAVDAPMGTPPGGQTSTPPPAASHSFAGGGNDGLLCHVVPGGGDSGAPAVMLLTGIGLLGQLMRRRARRPS